MDLFSVGIFLFMDLNGLKRSYSCKQGFFQFKAMTKKSCWWETLPMLLLIGLEQKLKEEMRFIIFALYVVNPPNLMKYCSSNRGMLTLQSEFASTEFTL